MKTEGIKRVFHAWNLIFQEHVEQLTALDSAGGDGDLGVVMRDGFRIAVHFLTVFQICFLSVLPQWESQV